MSLEIKDFSDLIYSKLDTLNEEVVLTNPGTISKFPCREMNTPLKTVNITNALETFQISIKHWAEKQRDAMNLADSTDLKLLEYNLIRTNTSPCIYDQVLQKYGLTTTYEVKYNILTNAFQLIR